MRKILTTQEDKRHLKLGRMVWFIGGHPSPVIAKAKIIDFSYNSWGVKNGYYLDTPAMETWEGDFGLDIFLKYKHALGEYTSRRAEYIGVKTHYQACANTYLPRNMSQKLLERGRTKKNKVLNRYISLKRDNTIAYYCAPYTMGIKVLWRKRILP